MDILAQLAMQGERNTNFHPTLHMMHGKQKPFFWSVKFCYESKWISLAQAGDLHPRKWGNKFLEDGNRLKKKKEKFAFSQMPEQLKLRERVRNTLNSKQKHNEDYLAPTFISTLITPTSLLLLSCITRTFYVPPEMVSFCLVSPH